MCPPFETLIPQQVRGELSPEGSRRVEMHLSLCEACREEAQRLAGAPVQWPRGLSSDRWSDSQFVQLRTRVAKEFGHEIVPVRWRGWLRRHA